MLADRVEATAVLGWTSSPSTCSSSGRWLHGEQSWSMLSRLGLGSACIQGSQTGLRLDDDIKGFFFLSASSSPPSSLRASSLIFPFSNSWANNMLQLTVTMPIALASPGMRLYTAMGNTPWFYISRSAGAHPAPPCSVNQQSARVASTYPWPSSDGVLSVASTCPLLLQAVDQGPLCPRVDIGS